jgi:hypothetical protein
VPFVRFSRDRRGYEHVYLVDSSAERGRSRLLYWFRTPPGVKVGRSPFDSETQRYLERQNPGVQFDWPQIVAARMPPPAPVENWREKRRAERAIKRARAAEAAESDRFGGQDTVLVSDEIDESDGSVDLASDEAPDAEGATPEPLVARAEDLATDQAVTAQGGHGPQPAQIESGLAPRRGRRRRRRRGRGPADRTPQAEAASLQNGRLDPAGPPQEPSDEQ